MRLIKYRAKNLKNEWSYGFYFEEEIEEEINAYIIHKATTWYVDKKTVGQFTGLYDRNGKEIYEGDIVKAIEEYSGHEIFEIKWDMLKSCGCCSSGMGPGFNFGDYPESKRSLEIIGNIHESPQLLESNK